MTTPSDVHDRSEAKPPTRERILRAARLLFAEQGYDHATTMGIARAAGTSESQLLKNFGSKEGLLQAIFEQDWEQFAPVLQQVISRTAEPRERLKEIVRAVLEHLEGDPELNRLLAFESGRVRRRQGHKVLVPRSYVESVAMVQQAVEEMHRNGQLRAQLQPRMVRSALLGIVSQGLRDQLLSAHPDDDVAGNSEQILTMVELLLCCVTAPERQECPALAGHRQVLVRPAGLP